MAGRKNDAVTDSVEWYTTNGVQRVEALDRLRVHTSTDRTHTVAHGLYFEGVMSMGFIEGSPTRLTSVLTSDLHVTRV